MKPGLLYECFQQQIIYAFSRLNVTFGDYMKAIIDINHAVIYYSCVCALYAMKYIILRKPLNVALDHLMKLMNLKVFHITMF